MVVVNFATKEYARGQRRLRDSLRGHKCLLFNDYAQIGSPTHQQSPYEFKLHAIRKAFEVDDVVLWLDSSMVVVGDLSKIEKIILEDGFYGQEAGHYCGTWCNQHARDYFKLTTDEARESTGGLFMFIAGATGLHLKNENAMKFFYDWQASADAGCFRGDWATHRHDMVCASIIAQRMGFKYQRGGSHIAYIGNGYSRPEEGVVLHCVGL